MPQSRRLLQVWFNLKVQVAHLAVCRQYENDCHLKAPLHDTDVLC